MNTQNETNPSADSASSASSALNQSTHPSTGRPLTRLLELSERQLQHVNAWLKEGVSYRKIVEFCRTEFEKEIPYMTFVRYGNRTHSTRQIEELADSKEVAAELSKYAVTGNPSFSANTLETFEQMAFDLAVAYSRDHDAGDLATIQQLWPLIHRAKSTSIRERHATVQEQKLQLRREELALKREMFHARLDGRFTPNRNLNPNLSPEGPVCPNGPSRDTINPAAATPAGPASVSNAPITSEKTQHSALSTGHLKIISPCPLPPEVIEANLLYAEKVRTGKIIIDRSGPWVRAIELPDTDNASGQPLPENNASPSP
jgi:hypothetical protein